MEIRLKRGKNVVKTISTGDPVKREVKVDYNSNLNVRINRRETIKDNVKITPRVEPKKDVVPKIITDPYDKKDNKDVEFNTNSNFIPKRNKIEEDSNYNTPDKMLDVFGLTDKDFEEPKDEEVVSEAVSKDTAPSSSKSSEFIRDKYSEYDEDYDTFEKIRNTKKNIDKY